VEFPLKFYENCFHSETYNNFATTPICFSGPYREPDLLTALSQLNSIRNFGGCYLQTRLALEEHNSLPKNEQMIISYRTVYNLQTDLSFSDWLHLMKRDSRVRFKKAMTDLNAGILIPTFYDFHDTVEPKVIDEIWRIYATNSLKNNFSSSYKFTAKQFHQLVQDPAWCLLTINLETEIVGFAIIGDAEIELDYSFAIAQDSPYEVSRALIICSFERAGNKQKQLCLGAGIYEGDKLSAFKARMGSAPKKYLNLKLISDNLLAEVGAEYFYKYQNERWPLG